jgi:hypothetical protein
MVTRARYETLVRIAHPREVNMMINPTAEVSLVGATGVGLAGLTRQTAGGFPTPHDTAFRLYGSASTTSSWLNIDGDQNAGIRNGMQIGVEYTVSATLRLAAPISGTVGQGRRIVVYYRIGSGSYVAIPSAQAPNAAGQTRLSVTFTLPAGTTEAFIRFFHGIQSTESVWWHSIRLTPGTATDYFDGNTPAFRELEDPEYGWVRTPGLSPSWRIPAGGIDLIDAKFDTLSIDRLRVPFIDATITMPHPGDEVLARLDPRVSDDVILYYNVQHYQTTGLGPVDEYASHAPATGVENGRGKLWLRSIDEDLVKETITLRATSGEVRFEDKKRISDFPLDTGATTVAELWNYALVDVGEAAAYQFIDGYALAAIPAGDRRMWMQGESASQLFETEMLATTQPIRSYCNDVGYFSVRQFTQPPGYSGALVIDLASGDSGTIVEASASRSRDDGWADATLVKATFDDANGDPQTQYQRYPANGDNRAGQVVDMSRPIYSSLIAQNLTREAERLGRTVRITALADFRCRPGRRIDVELATGRTFTLDADRVTYRIREGLMEIEGYER